MDNTTSIYKSFKLLLLTAFLFLSSLTTNAQNYVKHYIAPAPWQYYSDANVLVIATESTTVANVQVAKSDGTVLGNVTTVKGSPTTFRFVGDPLAVPINTLNTVLNGAGLIITSTIPVSVNVRNIASDAFGATYDANIKGNASLASFGDAGIGSSFRVGYYRDGNLTEQKNQFIVFWL